MLLEEHKKHIVFAEYNFFVIIFSIYFKRFTNIQFMRKEQAELVAFGHKALAAPSIVKLEKQTN